ncbi:hypothetical protein K3G39_16475 [Pontibacter sp. HSC-14F20]|uniref:hypothetical protein n=1 Tax=Pontibacter sp. HSC-14F20 TaxID=2864136 RepID=UPI001C73025B|nr:hypothetical protein [Pontibacter sp. HSC-14F20]MBX0334837.1 hypothetical protein [Pontibacter sp. HSC-14F20]
METMPYTLPEFKLSEPDQALLDFCARHPKHEAQQRLWKWFILALKNSKSSCVLNTELISFYEDINTLVSALYQLHDLPDKTGSPPQLSTTPICPEKVSLAEALESLHTSVSANWMLLVCPPD